MQKQSGFTLVELVVVIIILGILAVTAAPKFINMQSDARVSTLQGVKGAINGANVMVYAKASLEGKNHPANDTSVDVTISGTGKTAVTVPTVYGYVAATSAAIAQVADLNTQDWNVIDSKSTTDDSMPTKPTAKSVIIHQKNAPKTCYIEYTQASSTALPTFDTTHAVAKDC